EAAQSRGAAAPWLHDQLLSGEDPRRVRRLDPRGRDRRWRPPMTIRVVAVGVGHWHAVYDAAYLRQLVAMPDVELVGIQDADAALVARRASQVTNPPTFTDYRSMLETTRPDFVVALGRHRQMAGIAHDLLDLGFPFLMEKPMGINASEVEAVAAKAASLKAF